MTYAVIDDTGLVVEVHRTNVPYARPNAVIVDDPDALTAIKDPRRRRLVMYDRDRGRWIVPGVSR